VAFVAGTTLTAADLNAALVALSPVGTSSPSASSSVSINSCFSSTYDVYDIDVYGTISTGSSPIALRLRASGSDDSSSNYAYSLIIDNPTAPASALATGQSSIALMIGSTGLIQARVTVARPALAVPTSFRSHYVGGTTSPVQGFYAGVHNVSSAFAGFTLIPGSGTFTGEVRVYARRKAA